MTTGTKLKIAGGLLAAFAYAATLWSVYPENQQLMADTYQSAAEQMGWREPAPPPPTPPRYFIEGGFEAGPDTAEARFLPAMAVEGCSADGKVVRFVYETAILADSRKDDILSHARIANDVNEYQAVRRGDIISKMQEHWQAAVQGIDAESAADAAVEKSALAGLDFADTEQGNALQSWLDKSARDLKNDLGLTLAFKVNVASAIDIRDARDDVLDACSPAGFVPPPLEDTDPAKQDGPLPF